MDIQGLKDKILQLAIQGKLVEQDESDEPASELLKRIKEERDKLIKEKKIRKQKSLPDIKEEEKPFEIPKKWEWVRLGEIIRVSSGKSLTAKNMITEGQIPVYGGNGITGNHNDYNIEKPTIIIGRVGFYCGSIHLVTEKAWITDNAFITHYSTDNIYIHFLRYLLKGTDLRKNDNATAQPVISGGKIYPIVVPLPPLAEQKRIVEKIDQLFSLIDELDSNKEDLLEVIKLTRNQVLQEAIQGKLVEQNPEDEPASILLEKIKEEKDKLIKEKKIKRGKPLPEITEEDKPFEIPEGWEWVRLGDIVNLQSGNSPNKYNVSSQGIYLFIKVGDMNLQQNKKEILDSNHFTDKYIEMDMVKEYSIIFPKRGGAISTNKKRTVKKSIYIDTNTMAITPYIKDIFNYVRIWFNIIDLWKLNSGTAVPQINNKDIQPLLLPLPPLAEQKCIVEKVDTIMSLLDELEDELINNV